MAGIETVSSPEGRRWAAAGLEGDAAHLADGGVRVRVVRRLQNDGPRLDSEALDPDPDPNPHHGDALGAGERRVCGSGWRVLDSARDMELYSHSLAGPPSQRARMLPGALAAFKVSPLGILFTIIISICICMYIHMVSFYS